MFDKGTIFTLALQQLRAMALHWNEEGRKRWELAVANWKLNAAWARDNGKPLPAKPEGPVGLMTVAVPAGSVEQSQIVTALTDTPVSDLPCELLAVATPAPLPQGVTAVGYDYGSVFSALPEDTMPNGAKVPWKRASGEAIVLLKHFIPWQEAGALFAKVNFYEVVKG